VLASIAIAGCVALTGCGSSNDSAPATQATLPTVTAPSLSTPTPAPSVAQTNGTSGADASSASAAESTVTGKKPARPAGSQATADRSGPRAESGGGSTTPQSELDKSGG